MKFVFSLLLLGIFCSFFLDFTGATTTNKPTFRPSAKPSVKPSLIPSANPTRKPTAKPTRKPSQFPTSHPTARPTAHPTARPTGHPTAHPIPYPTAHPTPHPSASKTPSKQPTSFPTPSPTIKKSTRPTFKPSFKPSRRPSRLPTSHPSSYPTAATKIPTAPPTKRESSSLIFTSNITLEGVFTTDLKSSDQNAIISATASSMNISFTSVIFLGDILQSITDDYWDTSNIHLASSTFIARTRTSVLLPPESDPVVLWTHLTSLLKRAVKDGNYSKHLQAACSEYGSVSLVNVEATSVTISPAVKMSVDRSSSDSKAISTGAIGIAIGGAAVLLAVIIAIGLYFYCYSSIDTTSASNSGLETAVIAVPVDPVQEAIPSAPEQGGVLIASVAANETIESPSLQQQPSPPPENPDGNQQQQQLQQQQMSLRKGEEILL